MSFYFDFPVNFDFFKTFVCILIKFSSEIFLSKIHATFSATINDQKSAEFFYNFLLQNKKQEFQEWLKNGLDINLDVFCYSCPAQRQIKKVHLNKLLCCALLVKEKVHTFFFTKKEESVLQSFFVLLLHC